MMTYTATQWSSVKDKEKFVKHFKRFVEKGFPESFFTKWFYIRMSMMRQHIAEFNQQGFYAVWFSTWERRADFLRRWGLMPCFGDPGWTWVDVEEVLAVWLKEHPQYRHIQESEHHAMIIKQEKAELERLKAKYE